MITAWDAVPPGTSARSSCGLLWLLRSLQRRGGAGGAGGFCAPVPPGTPGGPSGPRPRCLPFTVGAAPVSFLSMKSFAAHSPCSPVPSPLSQHPEVFHMVGASLPRPYKLHTPGWSHCICLPLQLRSRSFGPLPATSPVSLTLSGVFLGHRAVLCVLGPLNVLMKVCLIR